MNKKLKEFLKEFYDAVMCIFYIVGQGFSFMVWALVGVYVLQTFVAEPLPWDSIFYLLLVGWIGIQAYSVKKWLRVGKW